MMIELNYYYHTSKCNTRHTHWAGIGRANELNHLRQFISDKIGLKVHEGSLNMYPHCGLKMEQLYRSNGPYDCYSILDLEAEYEVPSKVITADGWSEEKQYKLKQCLLQFGDQINNGLILCRINLREENMRLEILAPTITGLYCDAIIKIVI